MVTYTWKRTTKFLKKIIIKKKKLVFDRISNNAKLCAYAHIKSFIHWIPVKSILVDNTYMPAPIDSDPFEKWKEESYVMVISNVLNERNQAIFVMFLLIHLFFYIFFLLFVVFIACLHVGKKKWNKRLLNLSFLRISEWVPHEWYEEKKKHRIDSIANDCHNIYGNYSFLLWIDKFSLISTYDLIQDMKILLASMCDWSHRFLLIFFFFFFSLFCVSNPWTPNVQYVLALLLCDNLLRNFITKFAHLWRIKKKEKKKHRVDEMNEKKERPFYKTKKKKTIW